MSTTNIELEQIADFYKLPLIGVVQRDNLKTLPYHNNYFYIINSQPSTLGSGSHWTCLYLNKNTSFYFDSYAAPPPRDVVMYCRKYSKYLKSNNMIIQDLSSNNCGIYAIGFMLFMVKNEYNYIDFINAFDDNTERNDGVLEGLIRIYTNRRPIRPLLRFFNSNPKK